jgi:hypothetical protein
MERATVADSMLVRLCLFSFRALEKLKGSLSVLLGGFWLGVLSREDVNSITEVSYDRIKEYRTEEYNRRGLFDWERLAVERYFSKSRSILVAGTGGGREVLALRRLGITADGFESHPEFVRFANELLEKEGLVPDVLQAPWDGSPEYDKKYDGVIVGWGVYMHIRGRERRVRFLRSMRERVSSGAPILISFSAAPGQERMLRLTARIGNLVRRVARRDPVETGESLSPYFIRYFSHEELEEELRQAGFQLVYDDLREHPHAVGVSQ